MKKFLIIFSIVAFVILTALISVPYWADVNDYKSEISDVIMQKSGRKVAISGNITLQILPEIALTVENASVASAFDKNSSVLSIPDLILKVKLIPLFNRRIEVISLKLVNPVIDLHKKSDGSTNWTAKEIAPPVSEEIVHVDSMKLEGDAEELIIMDYGNDIASNTSFYDLLQFDELKIINGSFRFKDEQNLEEYNISNLNIVTSLSPSDNPFSISGELNIFEDPTKGKFSIAGKYHLQGHKYSIEDIVLTLDKIRGDSNIIIDPAGFKPTVNITLYFGDIDLNGYDIIKPLLVAESKVQGTVLVDMQAEDEENYGWSDEPLNFNFINEFDGNLSFKSTGLSLGNLRTGNVEFNSYLRNNRLSVNLKNTKMYGGNVTGEITINNSGGPVYIDNKVLVSGIDLAEIPKDISFIKSAKGNIDGTVAFTSLGFSQKDFISSLTGISNIKVDEGVLEGVDLFSMVNNVTAAFNIGSNANKTRFEEISASFTAKNGVLSSDDFILKSDLLNFVGEGTIDLNNVTIDYTVTPKYSQDFKDKEKQAIVVPILITGDLARPVFRLEVKSIVRDLINNPKGPENLVNQLKRDFRNMKKNIGSDSGEKMLNDLKNIFK